MGILSGIKESTEDQYAKIMAQLQSRWAKEIGEDTEELPWRERPMEFCHWFGEMVAKRQWSKPTFWLYRAACIWYFLKNGPVEAVSLIKSFQGTHLQKKGAGTSSRKMKKLNGKILEELLWKLKLNTGKEDIDIFIANWLEAGCISGLRPIEWKDASFDVKTNTLIVKNAKFNQWRANGECRRIIYDSKLHHNEIIILQRFLSDRDKKTKHETFESLYQRCRKRLWYVGSVLWPRASFKPSLYSARHQFAANIKKAGLTKTQVAALMGHKSDLTATYHYARKCSGLEMLPPSSPAVEVENVIKKDGHKITLNNKKGN